MEKWKSLLLELKEWLGVFRINFLGGEPLIYRGLFEVLAFCQDNDIFAGITTNGSHLTEENARRLCELEVFNVSISLDSIDPAKHDRNRGFEGSYEKIMRGLDHLNKHRTARTRLCLRTTVMEWNVHELTQLADLGRARGVISGFQPIELRNMDEAHDSPEDYAVVDDYAAHKPDRFFQGLTLDSLPPSLAGNWVRRLDVLDAQIAALIDRKRRGWPILNSPFHLRAIRDSFHDPGLMFDVTGRDCKTGWETLIILPNGAVRSCSEMPTYGNVHHNTPQEIWVSQAARAHRKNCADCTRVCMNMYHMKRSAFEKAAMFMNFF